MAQRDFTEIAKNSKFIKRYKIQKIMETHDCQSPEGTRYIEKEANYYRFVIILSSLLKFSFLPRFPTLARINCVP